MAINSEKQDLDMQSKCKTILVSGASGIVGYGILKSLKYYKNIKLIGTTIYNDSVAPAFCDILEIAPKTDSIEYLDWLFQLIKKHSIDMIIPGIEVDMAFWNNHREKIESSGAFVLLNNSNLISLCLDKWKFYKKLEKYNFRYRIISTIEPDYKNIKFPVLLKPRCGFGSKGVVKITNIETLDKYKAQIGNNLMLQEFIDGDDSEVTASAFFDKNSKMKAYIMFKRELSINGFTEKAWVFEDSEIKLCIDKLADFLTPVGPTNFQFRKDNNGKWRLLEINPRISSSTSIRTAFGYNEAKMSIDYFLYGKKITQPCVKNGYAIRYMEDCIFYEDSINI